MTEGGIDKGERQKRGKDIRLKGGEEEEIGKKGKKRRSVQMRLRGASPSGPVKIQQS